MPNATVRANARTLPNGDPWTTKTILEESLLAVRAELTAAPLTEEREREIAACDRILERPSKLEAVR